MEVHYSFGPDDREEAIAIPRSAFPHHDDAVRFFDDVYSSIPAPDQTTPAAARQ